MYCRSCGKENPLHSANCLHCGSKVAIKQAVPLDIQVQESWKALKILAFVVLGVFGIGGLFYGLSGDMGRVRYGTIAPAPSVTATPTPNPSRDFRVRPTALCRDGTYSYSAHRRGTCSHHGGVAEWNPNP